MAVEYRVESEELVAASDGSVRYRGRLDGHPVAVRWDKQRGLYCKIDATTGQMASATFTK